MKIHEWLLNYEKIKLEFFKDFKNHRSPGQWKDTFYKDKLFRERGAVWKGLTQINYNLVDGRLSGKEKADLGWPGGWLKKKHNKILLNNQIYFIDI